MPAFPGPCMIVPTPSTVSFRPRMLRSPLSAFSPAASNPPPMSLADFSTLLNDSRAALVPGPVWSLVFTTISTSLPVAIGGHLLRLPVGLVLDQPQQLGRLLVEPARQA